MTDEEVNERFDDFDARYLNNTRYASRLAADYLAVLYGGRIDDSGKRRIDVTPGQLTGLLRRLWGLNAIVGREGDNKGRVDHRHHAIDAVVVALTEPRTVKQVADAAGDAERRGVKRLLPLSEPSRISSPRWGKW